MDRALDKLTGDIIDAEDLWSLNSVDRDRYECFGCGVPMLPCAYEPGKKVRPYFSAREKPHEFNCNADGEITLLAQAKTQSIATGRETFPGLMPQRLKLQVARPLTERGDEAVGLPGSIGHKRSFDVAKNSGQKQHPRTAGTIRSVCLAFLRYPFDRNQPLHAPDVSGTTYDSVFWRLKSNEITHYPHAHIFYAPLSWTRLHPTDSHLDVALGSGEWSIEEGTTKKKLTKPYRVRVQWTNWSTRSRSAVLREIEVVRADCIQRSKNSKLEKGWFFFIGQQDPADDSLFIVEDHRLVCCFCAELIYPKNASQNKKR